MKLKVINAFCDKIDHVTVYEPGTILEVKDVERAQDLITRELCKEFKGKTAPTFVLGDQESESEAGETNSSDSLTESEGESENNSENQSENNSENESEEESENELEEESENGSSETSPNSDNDE
jgi:mature parasite-infected erythrocyte surface antigen|nr:MAG TPA: hypothetical protein [Caudoviricetes sp.]